MKRNTLFLQAAVVFAGAGALAFLLLEPHLEGRNVNSTFFEIYFKDPFLAYVYLASIPFFIALYQIFNVLKFAGQNRTFSQETGKALRIIKYCAISILCFIAGSVIFIYPMFGDKDDRPAGVFMRLLIAFASIVIVNAAAMFEKILKNAMDSKLKTD